MAEHNESYLDPSDWIHGIPQKVEQLAQAGDLHEYDTLIGYYDSSDENVEYIATRTSANTDNPIKSTVQTGMYIRFKDGSTYDITWAEGEIWSLSHSVSSEAEAEDESRILPYSGGKLRHSYDSKREISPAAEAQGYLNLRNTLTHEFGGEPLVAEIEVDDLIKDVMKRLKDSGGDPSLEKLDMLQKDVDPADLDLHAMFQQIHDIDPVRDRLDPESLFSEVINPEEYAYFATENARIGKIMAKLERQNKPDDVCYKRLMSEVGYVNTRSPHVGKHLGVHASHIRRLPEGQTRGEKTDVQNVHGTLRALIYTQWENAESGEEEEGLLLLVELWRPYPDDVFTPNDNSPFSNPVAFIPAASITELRHYPSVFDNE